MKAILAREPVGGLSLFFGDYDTPKRDLPVAAGTQRQSCIPEHWRLQEPRLAFLCLIIVQVQLDQLVSQIKAPKLCWVPLHGFFFPVNEKQVEDIGANRRTQLSLLISSTPWTKGEDHSSQVFLNDGSSDKHLKGQMTSKYAQTLVYLPQSGLTLFFLRSK